jgi:hypothetical protein
MTVCWIPLMRQLPQFLARFMGSWCDVQRRWCAECRVTEYCTEQLGRFRVTDGLDAADRALARVTG